MSWYHLWNLKRAHRFDVTAELVSPTWLTVSLKFPQIRMVWLSLLTTGTIGVAKSENCMGHMMRSLSRRFNSSSALLLRPQETGLALQKCGLAPGSILKVALYPFSVLNPGLNNSVSLSSLLFRLCWLCASLGKSLQANLARKARATPFHYKNGCIHLLITIMHIHHC